MSRSEQIGIVHEVVTAAYDMRRNNDPMQELFYRVQRLTANQVGERLYPTSA